MNRKPIRIAQVGLGDFGKRWLQVLATDSRWKVAAIATRDAEVRRQCGRFAGVPDELQFETLEEILAEDVFLDAVLITTPVHLHREQVLLSIAHGCHVLVEKPLVGEWSHVGDIRSAAAGAPTRKIMVAENYRYGDGAKQLRDIVASGEIGQPEYISIQYFVRHEFPQGDWRNSYKYPLLVENATHHFDLLRYVTGREPESVYCSAYAADTGTVWEKPSVSAKITMAGGLHVDFLASWAYAEFNTPWEGLWRLHGTAGSALWERDGIAVSSREGTRRISVPSLGSDHTIKATLNEFTRSILEDRPPEVNLADNSKTLGMVFGAVMSDELGRVVSMKELRGY